MEQHHWNVVINENLYIVETPSNSYHNVGPDQIRLAFIYIIRSFRKCSILG